MFFFWIPRFRQISSNLSFRSWCTSGFRAVGRVTVMGVTLCWSWRPLGQGGQMMGMDGTDWGLRRSEGGAVAWVDFDIFRMPFCTERDFITSPSPSLGVTYGEHLSSGEDRWPRRRLGQSLYLLPTPRWISVWEYFTIQLYHFGFFPFTKNHLIKNNIFIVDCFNYVKCIVSLICGGNRTQVRTS